MRFSSVQQEAGRGGELLQLEARVLAPAAATDDDQGALGRGQSFGAASDIGRRRACTHGLRRCSVGHLDLIGQHVFRQRQHHR